MGSPQADWLNIGTASYDNAYDSFAAAQSPSTDVRTSSKRVSSFGDPDPNHSYPQLFHKNCELAYFAHIRLESRSVRVVVRHRLFPAQRTYVIQTSGSSYGRCRQVIR